VSRNTYCINSFPKGLISKVPLLRKLSGGFCFVMQAFNIFKSTPPHFTHYVIAQYELSLRTSQAIKKEPELPYLNSH